MDVTGPNGFPVVFPFGQKGYFPMRDIQDCLDDVEKTIGYSFQNRDLLVQAFIRSSYAKRYGGESNEQLEFIGDSVLGFIVTKELAENFGYLRSEKPYYVNGKDWKQFSVDAQMDEGDFTEIKKSMVNNQTLSECIDELGLGDIEMWVGNDDDKQKKAKANLCEAIIGAVAIDSGWDMEVLEDVVDTMLDTESFYDKIEDKSDEIPPEYDVDNAIQTLKEMGEHGYCSVPEYDIPDQMAVEDGRKWWSCRVYIRDHNISVCWLADSKKLAKKLAAFHALRQMFGYEDRYGNETER
jgi:ribonuclease-3